MIQKSNKLDNVPDKYHELNIFRTYDNQIQKTFLSYVYAADYDLMVESKINTKKARLKCRGVLSERQVCSEVEASIWPIGSKCEATSRHT